MAMKKLTCFFILIMLDVHILAQVVIPAAQRTELYIHLLKEKRVAIFANHTATIGKKHLVDSLLKLGIHIVKVFAPEHGFRGITDDGKFLNDDIDSSTGIRVISLYGKKLKPTPDDLHDVDIMLFDIQDVGTRFYTFISSLQLWMEAAFENSKSLIILDRPNPNGFYVDGPVLDTAYKSFVGMQPIPIVYGLTIGEYARMIAGEKWLSTNLANMQYQHYVKNTKLKDSGIYFKVVKCANYTHKTKYILPINPSPNLPDMASVYWYPSNCLFEGTILSEGRGTKHPFCIFGNPLLPQTLYSFIPTSTVGAAEPKFKNQICYGWNLYNSNTNILLQEIDNKIQLKYLIQAYQLFPQKELFFTKNKLKNGNTVYAINRLVGNASLVEQIKQGKTEAAIRAGWQPQLNAYKKIRKKYLLYSDFE